MEVILIILLISIPVLLLYLGKLSTKLTFLLNLFAIISMITFATISGANVYEIIVKQEVFMTTIHQIFLNPFFLISGSYLGIYIIYLLMMLTLEEW